jgi:hypothetical protein
MLGESEMTSIHPLRALLGLVAIAGAVGASCYFNHTVTGRDGDGDGFDAAIDCDDANAAIHPGAKEICNDGVDNDCDGKIDMADPQCGTGGGGGAGGAGGTGGTGGAGGATSTTTATTTTTGAGGGGGAGGA